jgi:hypothetical protein
VIRSWARYFLTRSAISRPTCSPDGARAESGRDFLDYVSLHPGYALSRKILWDNPKRLYGI